MIGLDTNILIRYILQDDPKWSPVVVRFIDSELTPERPGFINPVTLAELVWVLRKHSRLDRAAITEIITGLLDSDSVVIGQADAVVRALKSFAAGGAGFADYLIAELNQSAGAHPTVTLDAKAANSPLFTSLS